MKTQDEIDKACQLIVQRSIDYFCSQHEQALSELWADAVVFGLTDDEIGTRIEAILAENK